MAPSTIINRADLLRAFSVIDGAIMRRSGIPILTHVALDATADTITLRGTNMDLFAEAVVKAAGDTFTAAVPWDGFRSYIAGLPDGAQVSLALDSGRVICKCGRSSARFPSLDTRDFPDFPTVDGANFEIDAAELLRLLTTVAPFVDGNDLGHALGAVHLYQDSKASALVAVGGSRAAIADASTVLPEAARSMPVISLPPAAVSVITKLIDGADTASIAASTTLLRVAVGMSAVTTKLVDAQYPSYRTLQPPTLTEHANFDRAALIAALNRVLPMAEAEATGLRGVTFQIADGQCRISIANKAAHIDAEDVVDCEAEPAVQAFALNGGRVKQLLAIIEAETVSVRTDGNRIVFILEPVGAPSEGLRMTAPLRMAPPGPQGGAAK